MLGTNNRMLMISPCTNSICATEPATKRPVLQKLHGLTILRVAGFSHCMGKGLVSAIMTAAYRVE